MAVSLFLAGKSLPNYVEAVFASRRLPPKATVTVETGSSLFGIRNGGLDFVKAAVMSGLGHDDCLPNDGFFSFAVAWQ